MDKQRAGQLFDYASDLVQKYGDTNTSMDIIEEYLSGIVPKTITSINAKNETVNHTSPEFQACLAFARSIAKTSGVSLGAPRGRNPTLSITDKFLDDNGLSVTGVSVPDTVDFNGSDSAIVVLSLTVKKKTPKEEA